MTLRRQLVLVSLLTLVLPWAGCEFIQQTETALRDGQLEMLGSTSAAIADSLSQHPDQFLAGGDGAFSESQIYGHPLATAPLIDGYFNDWSLPDEALSKMRGSDGQISYALGADLRYLYLYLDMRDRNIVYASGTDSANSADAVYLVTGDDADSLSRIRFATEAPGRIAATREVGQDQVVDTRIVAHWEDTADGYRIEARIPRNLIGTLVGLEVVNAGDGVPVVSRSFERGVPGQFIQTVPLLASIAAGYAREGTRLIITNPAGWRLASAGSLGGGGPANADAPYSGWQTLLYRALFEGGTGADLAEPAAQGRETQNYIVRSLNGESTAQWFRNLDTGRAIVAVAEPVWSFNTQIGSLIVQQDTAAVLSLTNESLARLINLTVLATILAAAGLFGYATWLSLRVRNLSHAADNALDSGKSSVRLPSANAVDEIGDLSRSFSSVLTELGSYNEYLKTLAGKLSHEMRTPLTIVTSSLENLEHEQLSDQAREYTERASSGAARLRKILSAMSEASRVEQLIENADVSEFDLVSVTSSAVSAYGDAWPQRNFTFNSTAQDAVINGSPELIVQMLDKLIDNAVDFTNDGDTIVVGVEKTSGAATLYVENPGPPLPATMRHRLFQSMVSVRERDGDNLGLGLNIAKIIVDGHNGTISADNIDSGVRFEAILPLV